MSLRLVREKMYIPLPMGIDDVFKIYAKSSYSLPVKEMNLTEAALLFLCLGAKNRLRGLIVVDDNPLTLELSDTISLASKKICREMGLTNEMIRHLVGCALISVRYEVRQRNKEYWLDMDDFKYLDFALCWHKGKFLPSKRPQRLDVIKKLLAQNGIAKHCDDNNGPHRSAE